MPSEVRYHKSAENIDDAERATVKPLGASYHRFTLLERVLMVAVSVFIVLAIVFGILYAASKTSEKSSDVKDDVCITAECVGTASAILNSLDWSVDPCDDFYNFTCNKWLMHSAIPPRANKLTQFGKLEQENYKFLGEKLRDKDTIKKYENIEAVSKALADYSACITYISVNESSKHQQARKIISDYGGWNITNSGWSKTAWQLMPNLIKIHRDLKIFPLFFVGVTEDIKNSTRNQIVMVQRSSHYLPTEMFLDNGTRSTKMRNSYKDLMYSVITMLANTSKDDPVVGTKVEEIFEFEKLLAKISMPTLLALKKEAHYNPITIKKLHETTENTFNWLKYFKGVFLGTGVNITIETLVNVNQPNFIRNMTQMLRITDEVVLANYMMWEVICQTYNFFPRDIAEKFDEYRNSLYSLYGRRRNVERWKYCLSIVRNLLGLPLSMLYVDANFGNDELRHIEEMVEEIRKIYVSDVETLSWMDPETKKMALKKAKAIKQNIAFPKILLNKDELNKKYAELEIKRHDYLGNFLRKRKFAMKMDLKKLVKPVDKSDWTVDAMTSNAYYRKTENKIVVPAGILQPPFFDISRPMSLNYGAIGMIIGHELTHSFDDNGRKYDEHGNYFNWWKNSSLLEFKRRTTCLVEKIYSNYSYYGLKMDGKRTLNENFADNGGIKQAFEAYQTWRQQHDEPILPGLNLTNNQLFFIGSAQIWCSKYHFSLRKLLTMGPHPPGMIRVLGMLSNYPEFSRAFKCPVGSQMNPKKKCNIW